ncbi:MAG: glycosyltransferase family 2 protein [Caldilineaceae bacterium]|nr:glycosyltransferase family 2 protein [Caldilineaceae bacterium]MCB9140072.1 glycosyltransferase family 2 protein [Caldilineaceae bacterium]
MPVFNERATLEEIVQRVRAADLTVNVNGTGGAPHEPLTLEREIVIVDDGSTDGTRDILDQWQAETPGDMQIIYHAANGGKGAALRTAFNHASGDIFIIQDADLEYDPRDYVKVLLPILEGRTPVVYGSRFMGGTRSAMSLTHTMGNKFLTVLTNLFYGTSLTDMETCYKAFRRDVIADMKLRSRRFEIEPELTAKILKRGYTIFEVPITYNGREFHEGKKITWRDGFVAVRTLVKYRFVD